MNALAAPRKDFGTVFAPTESFQDIGHVERFFHSPRQERVQFGRRLASHFGQDMAVGVQGEGDLRMSEALLDDLRMDALGQQQSRRRMPQVVEPDRRKPGPLQ